MGPENYQKTEQEFTDYLAVINNCFERWNTDGETYSKRGIQTPLDKLYHAMPFVLRLKHVPTLRRAHNTIEDITTKPAILEVKD